MRLSDDSRNAGKLGGSCAKVMNNQVHPIVVPSKGESEPLGLFLI